MFGLLLTAFSTLTGEAGTSIGKWEATRGKEGVYSMGFLNTLWGTLFLVVLVLFVPKDFFAPGFPGGLAFSVASLPTLLPRIALEIAQAYATVYAIVRADRSTYGFLRIITIPLLLGADVLLGYSISSIQIAGMALIIVSLILLFINHGIRRQGAGFVLFTAINAVLTISLYKYDITHFNSVEAEQLIVSFALIIFFFVMARIRTKENPFRLLAQPAFFLQSLFAGIAGVGMSFAIFFGAASVITTAYRALSILFAMLAGRVFFREKAFWLKAISFLLIVIGLIFLAL